MANWANVKGVVIHHTATSEPADHDACLRQAAGIEAAHKGKYHDDDGNPAIAYNFLVCPHGEVVAGRGLLSTNDANGCTQANREYVAICLLGNNPGLSPAAERTVRALVGRVRDQWPNATQTLPHRDVDCASTTCPGTKLTLFARTLEEDDVARLTDKEVEWLKDLVDAADKINTGPGAVARAGRDKHTHSGSNPDVPPHTHTGSVSVS